MPITVHSINWNRTYFEIDYTATQGEVLGLTRLKTNDWVHLEEERDGEHVHARVNTMLRDEGGLLESGDWIVSERVDADLANNLDKLLEERPYLGPVIMSDYKKLVRKKERVDEENEEAFLKAGHAIWKQHPYDVHNIAYDESVMLGTEDCQRIFPYGSSKYAYAGRVAIRSNTNEHPYLVLIITFYQVNPEPKVRKESKRFKQKRILARVFSAISKLTPSKGNTVLFLKENGEAPTENMAVVRDRMIERGLDKQFTIKERYRNTFGGKHQNIFEWLGDLMEIAKADYIFIDDYCPVFNFLPLDEHVTLTQIWHAGVGFKSVGYARFGLVGSPDPYYSSHRAYTYALVGNSGLREIYSEVFGIGKERLLATGMPRLDHFLDEKNATLARAKLLKSYPVLEGKRVVVFAPTFRGKGQKSAYYPYDAFIDMDKLHAMCVETNTVFIFEMHHFIDEPVEIPAEYQDRILDLSHENLNELFHVADVLVTDYSSCFYDFQLLKKPVVFYTPDRVTYSAIRGTQRPVKEMAPGVVCDDFDTFIQVLADGTYEAKRPAADTLDRCIERSGFATDRVIDTVLLGRDVPGVRYQGE